MTTELCPVCGRRCDGIYRPDLEDAWIADRRAVDPLSVDYSEADYPVRSTPLAAFVLAAISGGAVALLFVALWWYVT